MRKSCSKPRATLASWEPLGRHVVDYSSLAFSSSQDVVTLKRDPQTSILTYFVNCGHVYCNWKYILTYGHFEPI